MTEEAICQKCGLTVDPTKHYKCPKCGGVLDFDLIKNMSKNELEGEGHWRYKNWMRCSFDGKEKNLGEGGTPLVKFEKNVFLKLEMLNPSFSFKDRGASVLVSALALAGKKRLFVDSSGNAGAALAAFSALHGLEAVVYGPDTTPVEKEIQIRSYGGKFVRIKGKRDQIVKSMGKEFNDKNAFYASHHYSPYYLQGTKVVAFEIAEQQGWNAPETIITPVGAGTLFLGLGIGFMELFENGIIKDLPVVYGVQANYNQPIVKALGGLVLEEDNGRKDLADAILTKNPPRLDQMKRLHEKGLLKAISVTDSQILSSWKKLAGKGFFVETTSATTLAAYERLLEEDVIGETEKTVLVITGTGLKQTSSIYAGGFVE